MCPFMETCKEIVMFNFGVFFKEAQFFSSFFLYLWIAYNNYWIIHS